MEANTDTKRSRVGRFPFALGGLVIEQVQCATGCHDTDGYPRPARYGILCAWCGQSLARAIAEIPDTLEHLYETAQGAIIQAIRYNSDPTGSSDPSQGTVLHPAWLAANELEAEVNAWIDEIIRYRRPRPQTPEQANEDPASWLYAHLGWIVEQYWAKDMREELPRHVSTLKARWPTSDMIERERHIPDVPCPRCGHISLTYWPVREYKQTAQVGCGNPDCARIYNENEWERHVHLIEQNGAV